MAGYPQCPENTYMYVIKNYSYDIRQYSSAKSNQVWGFYVRRSVLWSLLILLAGNEGPGHIAQTRSLVRPLVSCLCDHEFVFTLRIHSQTLNFLLLSTVPAGFSKNTFLSFRCMKVKMTIWIAPCENMSSGMCGQQRPRSACAHGLTRVFPVYRIIGYYRMFQWRANGRMRLCACVRWI